MRTHHQPTTHPLFLDPLTHLYCLLDLYQESWPVSFSPSLSIHQVKPAWPSGDLDQPHPISSIPSYIRPPLPLNYLETPAFDSISSLLPSKPSFTPTHTVPGLQRSVNCSSLPSIKSHPAHLFNMFLSSQVAYGQQLLCFDRLEKLLFFALFSVVV